MAGPRWQHLPNNAQNRPNMNDVLPMVQYTQLWSLNGNSKHTCTLDSCNS